MSRGADEIRGCHASRALAFVLESPRGFWRDSPFQGGARRARRGARRASIGVVMAHNRVPAFVVLVEDTYETRYGDGYFAYFANAFLDEHTARDWIAARQDRSPIAMAAGPAYHLREAMLVRDGAAWQLTIELRRGEQADVEQVVGALGL